jgi:dTDP-4-dehydrorhamnose 3,5-epimerase
MNFDKCDIEGLIVVTPRVFEDSRGLFFESYNREAFRTNGIDVDYLQDNQSHSTAGVIRGLHFQRDPHAQGKLVRVLQGSIMDVAVDIRKSSSTYGKVFSIELSADNKKQLWIPAGFAHGFSVLSDSAVVLYKCDKFYNKDAEGGIRFDDPELNIDWKTDVKKAVVSEKDLNLPWFRECNSNFR